MANARQFWEDEVISDWKDFKFPNDDEVTESDESDEVVIRVTSKIPHSPFSIIAAVTQANNPSL